MHAAALAVLVITAGGAVLDMHPGSVAEGPKPAVPNFHEIILIYIALNQVAVDIRTGRYRPVRQDGSDMDPGPAEEQTVPDPAFPLTGESLATE